jgi:4-diphosphocytidyl-2-C-methyl-D-erythritol kinase
VKVEIAKLIPVAGGMGGGSADAAALVRIAPRLAPISDVELAELAASLGADVPAQLRPGLALGIGAGDLVRPLPPLAPHVLVIVPLDQQLSTAAVYAEADRLGLPRGREELEAQLSEVERTVHADAPLPRSLLVNDLEPAARSLCPAIAGALDSVWETGADQALLCGSGPTVAGLYWGDDGAVRAEQAPRELRRRFPGARAVVPLSSQPSGKIPSG